ncbi:hypothetical protein [Hymenobacter sp. PAMC 26628]|uniref:hypothetical protein n=1 Tax=Hymenobacter sp. PAMC 26628 TaxID=1484118 RepID=UPI0007701D64|nr:hypothetical protein [Hymenobacter sp. PAMC 26628]AMJ66603.1 hypothetical protein AXW84_15090 [Hymenobacter sp. PAMC 26628]
MRLLLPLLALLSSPLVSAHAQGITDPNDGIRGVADSRQRENLAQGRNPPLSGKATPAGNQPAKMLGGGTTYLFSYWTKGVLRSYTGATRHAWVKYNLMDRQLITRTTAGELSVEHVVNMDTLREFTIGDSAQSLRVVYRRYLQARVAKPALRTAFFEVHYDAGRTALLCQRTNFPNRADVLEYFVKTPDNRILPVKLDAEPLLGALGPGRTPALAAYARQHRLELSREADVVRLLAYCDTL